MQGLSAFCVVAQQGPGYGNNSYDAACIRSSLSCNVHAHDMLLTLSADRQLDMYACPVKLAVVVGAHPA